MSHVTYRMVSVGGVTPDIVSFNCLIAAHAAAGDPDKARAWLERASHWGLSADVVTYTTVISGYSRCVRAPLRSHHGQLRACDVSVCVHLPSG